MKIQQFHEPSVLPFGEASTGASAVDQADASPRRYSPRIAALWPKSAERPSACLSPPRSTKRLSDKKICEFMEVQGAELLQGAAHIGKDATRACLRRIPDEGLALQVLNNSLRRSLVQRTADSTWTLLAAAPPEQVGSVAVELLAEIFCRAAQHDNVEALTFLWNVLPTLRSQLLLGDALSRAVDHGCRGSIAWLLGQAKEWQLGPLSAHDVMLGRSKVAVQRAAARGDLAGLHYLRQYYTQAQWNDLRAADCYTLCRQAALAGHADVVLFLIGDSGEAMHQALVTVAAQAAARAGHVDLSKQLRQRLGADAWNDEVCRSANAILAGDSGYEMMRLAAHHGHHDVVKFLLNADARAAQTAFMAALSGDQGHVLDLIWRQFPSREDRCKFLSCVGAEDLLKLHSQWQQRDCYPEAMDTLLRLATEDKAHQARLSHLWEGLVTHPLLLD